MHQCARAQASALDTLVRQYPEEVFAGADFPDFMCVARRTGFFVRAPPRLTTHAPRQLTSTHL